MNRNQTGKRTDQERFAELLSRGQISRAILTWIDVFKKEWPLTYSKMDLQFAVRFFTGAGNNMDSERVYLIGSEDEPKKVVSVPRFLEEVITLLEENADFTFSKATTNVAKKFLVAAFYVPTRVKPAWEGELPPEMTQDDPAVNRRLHIKW